MKILRLARISSSISVVAIGAALVGCSGQGQTDAQALSSLTQAPSAAVCSQDSQRRCLSQVRVERATGRIRPFATPAGYGALDLAAAYNLDTTRSPGATIAIVDAFGYPNAESDLAQYRAQFGLSPCTQDNGCLTIVNQDGATSPLPPAPAPGGDDWTVETALDLDMASAACPNCKLLLVQAQNADDNGLLIAQVSAAKAGAAVISDSWGEDEPADAATQESTYFGPASTTASIFVASGDSGYTGTASDYPSVSAFVTAVGGTTLARTQSARGWSENAWSGAGSSCAKAIAKPDFQGSVATGCSNRAAADVSAVGDPATPVAVFNAGAGGWIAVGGTSASSPFVAGVYALTGHGGAGPAFAYQNSGAFYDVVLGSNGSCGAPLCTAGPGWDGPTGWGTPNGALLVNSAPPQL
jgi:subtilase family serine protease